MHRSEPGFEDVAPPAQPAPADRPGPRRALARIVSRFHRLERLLPAIYAAYAIPLAIFFVFAMPAFRVPDELWHFARAEQIGTGGLLTWRQNTPGAGGIVDSNIVTLDAITDARLDWAGKGRIDAALLRQGQSLAWGGERRFIDMAGIGPYPPFLYLPAVAAIWAGKALRLSIDGTLRLSRLVNAAVALGLAVFALALMPYGRAAMFAFLSLPMTIHQFASASQDALLIATVALVAALVARALFERRPLRRGEAIAVIVLVTLDAMARPPMLAVALVLLIPGLADARRWPRAGARIVALLTLIVLAWVAYIAVFTSNGLGHLKTPVSPVAQLAQLLERPLFALNLVAETWRLSGDNLSRHFIGELGRVEITLPAAYYNFIGIVLACGLAAALLERGAARWPAIAIVVGTVVVAVLGILFTLYLTWTPLGWTYIEGPHGRYFIPLALLLCAGMPALGFGAAPRAALTCFVAAAPLTTLAVVPWAVIVRYYLPPG